MSDEIFIAHRLLDEQILDSEGKRCGRVDDIELGGSPPRITACRAGLWPRPACSTHPMMHSSIFAGSTPARFTASRTTRAPSCGEVYDCSEPWNLPMGVRTAETITTSRISSSVNRELQRSNDTSSETTVIGCAPER